MKRTPLAALALALALSLSAPSSAQDWRISGQPQAAPPAKPVAKPKSKPVAAKSVAAKPTVAKPAVAKSAAKPGAKPVAEVKPTPENTAPDAKPAAAPTAPPNRAAEAGGAAPTAPAPTPAPAAGAAGAAVGAGAVTGAAVAASAAAPQKPLDRAEAIKRAEASLNSSPVMIADFVQIGGDGRRSEGKLYVHKVGRMRFEYAQPATMEVVADGVSVAVRDRKLNTQDLYFIGQTPLKFLLNEKIDLEKDVKLLDVVIDDSGASIQIEDKATFGGASKIKLIFDSKTFVLKQWQVSDPQGYETLVSLFNIDRATAPDPKLFKITKESLLDFH